MITARDWVDAVIHLADRRPRGTGDPELRGGSRPTTSSPASSPTRCTDRRSSGCRRRCSDPAAGQMSNELLGSYRLRPGGAAGQRLHLPRPGRPGGARRGARTLALTSRQPSHAPDDPAQHDDPDRAACVVPSGRTPSCPRDRQLSPGDPVDDAQPRGGVRVAVQHAEREDLRHDAAYDEPAGAVGTGAAGRRPRRRPEPRSVERPQGRPGPTRPRRPRDGRPSVQDARGRATTSPRRVARRGRGASRLPRATRTRRAGHSPTLPAIDGAHGRLSTGELAS